MHLPVPLQEALSRQAAQLNLSDQERKRFADLVSKMDAGTATDEEENEATRMVTQRPRRTGVEAARFSG